jgi:single stranded DNA-binding protein
MGFMYANIAGRLTKEPEFKEQNGRTWCFFSLAVNYKARGKEQTSYVNVKAWSPFDRVVSQMKITKGALIMVSGKIDLIEYNGRTSLEINATTFEYLYEAMGSNQNQPKPNYNNNQYNNGYANNQPQQQFNSYQPAPNQQPQAVYQKPVINQVNDALVDDEDLPF